MFNQVLQQQAREKFFGSTDPGVVQMYGRNLGPDTFEIFMPVDKPLSPEQGGTTINGQPHLVMRMNKKQLALMLEQRKGQQIDVKHISAAKLDSSDYKPVSYR
jgi:hypothetical protein